MTLDPSRRQSTFIGADEDDELIEDEEQKALLEAENGLQQFDEVLRMAEEAISNQQFELTPALIAELNRLAIKTFVVLPASSVVYELVSPTVFTNHRHPMKSKITCERCVDM